MGQLVAGGHELTPSPEEADVIVVNTCSFIDPVNLESIDTIIEMGATNKPDARKSSSSPVAWSNAIAILARGDSGAAGGPPFKLFDETTIEDWGCGIDVVC